MITVRLLGGAKRPFLSDKISVDSRGMAVSDLVAYLQRLVQEGRPAFDAKNVLIAVNGVDSSAMQGGRTMLKDGDVVSIIPVVHGGGKSRISFKVLGYNVELIRIGKKVDDPIGFLEGLRKRFPKKVIQGIRAKYILGTQHASRIVEISVAAQRSGTMLSNRVETDMLMRFAGSRQISEAIKKAGLRRGEDSILVVIGRSLLPRTFFSEMRGIIKPILPYPNNANYIKKEFNIPKKELGCLISQNPLEDVLVERSAVLLH